jgi:hypothetical protein
MRYLKLVILVSAYALIPPAFARTCCPTGCVQDGNRCATTGPLWTKCTPIPCAGGTQLRITTATVLLDAHPAGPLAARLMWPQFSLRRSAYR